MAVRHSIKENWIDFIENYEGRTNWLYFDKHDPPLATTGIGNLISHNTGLTTFGFSLPWRFIDGTWATELQIGQEYKDQKARKFTGDGFAWEKTAKLFLDDEDVDFIVLQKLESNQKELAKRFPDFEEWPADAQLAIHNMAWLMGPAFAETYANHPGWPKLRAALKAGDFKTAADQCWTGNDPNHNHRRNVQNNTLLLNADRIVKGSGESVDWHTLHLKVFIPKQTINSTKFMDRQGESILVQTALKTLGYYLSKIDGDFGKVSEAALDRFIKDRKAGSIKEGLDLLMSLTLKLKVI